MKISIIISMACLFVVFSCGEEKEMPIARERLTVSEPVLPDSVCKVYETMSDYKGHYEDIMSTLPSYRSVNDVRTVFRRHIEDSVMKEQANGVIQYSLNHNYMLRLHSDPFPIHVDSLILYKIAEPIKKAK